MGRTLGRAFRQVTQMSAGKHRAPLRSSSGAATRTARPAEAQQTQKKVPRVRHPTEGSKKTISELTGYEVDPRNVGIVGAPPPEGLNEVLFAFVPEIHARVRGNLPRDARATQAISRQCRSRPISGSVQPQCCWVWWRSADVDKQPALPSDRERSCFVSGAR